ncbi:MAG: transglycosylase domain-containing protein [Bacteriovoracaceae bacterium]|nr:transglycosylase domain-containing protein [Bacteriovoracaceae bacterium]
MRRIVRPLLIAFTFIAILLIAGVTIFVIHTLVSFPRDSFVVADKREMNAQSRPITLEEGSIADLSDLKGFFLFSGEEDQFSRWLKENRQQGNLEVIGNTVSFNKELLIDELLSNDCGHIYCYQHRVTFNEIPSVFWKGLIGIEDFRFLDHFGIDFKSILRALITDIKEMRFVQGGSTLTQQLVKNLFLTNEKKISRKLREIIYAIFIESKYSKEQILEAYFNEVYWGALQGVRIKGIFSASAIYFGKKPSEITSFEAAILISMLKGPHYYSPVRKIDRIKQRSAVVFKRLVTLGFLSSSDKMWSDSDWKNWERHLKNVTTKRFAYNVWSTLKDNPSGLDHYDRFIFRQGITALKPFIKSRVKERAKDISIKAVVGDLSGKNLFRYYSRIERNKIKALHGERHLVGSTLKPILYSVFLDRGRKYTDLVSLRPITLNLKSGRWSPRESHIPENPEVSLIDALFHSYNRPVIRIADELGWDEIQGDILERIPGLKVPLKEYPAQFLGGVEKSVVELYEIYRKFVIRECGTVRSENENLPFDRNLIYKMSDPNTTTIRKVVEGHLKNLRFFGKTGTSNNGLDNWYIAFDGKLLSVIWVGYEGDRSKAKLQLYGAGTAFRIYQHFITWRAKRFNDLSCDFADIQ